MKIRVEMKGTDYIFYIKRLHNSKSRLVILFLFIKEYYSIMLGLFLYIEGYTSPNLAYNLKK